MREPIQVFYLRMAVLAASRATCFRRAVGAVAVNVFGRELALGWNGVPTKFPHCSEGHYCEGAHAVSGTNLDKCLATHAEINLLSKVPDVWAIHTIYLTTSPCFNCTKALISSGCQCLVFLDEYPHPDARLLWERAGRTWVHADPLPPTLEDGSFY